MPPVVRKRDNILQMNNFINWVAVNNAFMIRIGFTAILALLVIYIFRIFFLPKVNMVNESFESENTGLAKSGNTLDEADLEKRRIVEEKQAEYYNLEIEKHLIEVAKLKDQLMDTNSLVSDLKEKNLDLTSQVENAVVVAPVSGEVADPEYVAELKNQVESLEARLSEYEIIAEDIAEIGQLRKEIAELRKQAEKPVSEELLIVDESAEAEEEVPEAEAAYESEAEPKIEPIPQDRINEELIADLVSAIEATDNPEFAIEDVVVEDVVVEDVVVEEMVVEEMKVEESPALVRIVSDKEVSASERDMIDHFEEITKKKGS